MVRDMTEGKPSKVIISYSVPIILSGMFQQFYNIADSLIAGKYAGVDALAAVGASYPITMLFIAVATGAGMGGSVIISQMFGAKDYQKMKTAASTAVVAMFVLSILLTVIGQLVNNGLMKLLRTPDSVFSDGALYLRIYIAGLVFLFLYNIANAIFNGLGDSKTSLYFLIFSSIFNVILDYIFVAVFDMGVAGVAWATFIAQGIASVLAIFALAKRIRGIKTEGQTKKFDSMYLKQMSRIAVPSIFQQSTVSIGQLFVQMLVNGYGASVIAGYAAAVKLDSFLKMVVLSTANAVSSYTAQNAGARKLHRVKEGALASIKIMFGYGVIAFLLLWFFGDTMIGWFISDGTAKEIQLEVLRVGTTYMSVVSAFYFVFALSVIGGSIMRGVGYMSGYMTTTLVDLVLRVAGSYVLAYLIGYNAIWWSIPLGWVAGMIVAAVFLGKGNWRKSWI